MILFGPTAVGKTELLFRLFEGTGEIISVDSMQVYRGMDIGTAKPSESLRTRIPHHLIDIKNPDEQYNVGEFVHAAEGLVERIRSRGRIPVLSGGTAFYFKHFLFGLPSAPAVDPAIRAELQDELARGGTEALYERLAAIDPVAADKIHQRDTYRVLRALEIHRMTGNPPSSFRNGGEMRTDFRFFIAGLDRERGELYRRIDQRVDAMFRDGLPGEVSGLIDSGYGEETPGMQAIGYREFFRGTRTGCTTLHGIAEDIKRNSRRYAKRQLTFFRSLPGTRWYHPDEEDSIRRDLDGFFRD